jgi:hypothetical protein
MRRAVQATIVLLMLALVGGFFGVFIYSTRISANRTQCINNLKQIGIAVHNYHDTYKRYPSGTVPNAGLPADQRFSWLTEIWPPFMEGGIMTRFEKTKPWDAPENNPPVYLVRVYPKDDGDFQMEERVFDVAAFLCPANPDRGGPNSANRTHYVGIAGVGEIAAELPLCDPRAGFFGYDRKLTRNDIKRGLDATLMLAEVGEGGPWTAGGKATVRGLDGHYVGEVSFHGDVNFAFADASVRPLYGSISPTVFEALAVIAGNDVGPP